VSELELSKEQFIQRLIDAGWIRADAEKEYESIQEDDESGYDGP
jgi:hypothetical protein